MNKDIAQGTLTCRVCRSTMTPGLTDWHFTCPSCHYEAATLSPTINDKGAHQHIDEDQRLRALETLRRQNFARLAEVLRSHRPGLKGRLLDVGCAHGWFLEATGKDFEGLGIEPDRTLYDLASNKGLPVRSGFFPDALTPDETFDVISFHDVFEHLDDLEIALEKIHQRLRPEGLLLINLPSNEGIFYRMSKGLFQLGLESPFRRLWQEGLPSPHLHYFCASALERLVSGRGFERIAQGALPSLIRDGLFERVSYASFWPPIIRRGLYLALLTLLPILNQLPKDTIYVLFRRRD